MVADHARAGVNVPAAEMEADLAVGAAEVRVLGAAGRAEAKGAAAIDVSRQAKAILSLLRVKPPNTEIAHGNPTT